MNLYLRLIWTVIAALLGRNATKVMEEHVLTFRCWPHDLDTNLHMNNGRFLTLMDLGRLDLVVRGGLTQTMRRNGWMAVIGGAMVRYRRSIAPFEKFRLKSRLVGWDDRWFYIAQRFERRDGTLIAVALVRGAYRDKDGAVATSRVMADSGRSGESPPLPDVVARFGEADLTLDQVI